MITAFYCIYNEADFVQYSLRSIYDHVDQIIIIEGAWKESYIVNGHLRSNDGTIDIIKAFPDPDKKIELYFHNEDSQLKQRNLAWQYIKKDCTMLLVDGDEVWTKEQVDKIKEKDKSWPGRSHALPAFVYTVDSWIFINDFYTVSKVRYPRAWEIEVGCKHEFIEPNRILVNDLEYHKVDLDAHYFHYSYAHSPERFMEKKKERTKLHGNFAWELRNGKVQREGADINVFEGEHPEIMQTHPLHGHHVEVNKQKPETIIYIEHSGIGNLLLSVPMLKAIREAKPDCCLHVIAWDRSYRVIEGMPELDFVYHEFNKLGQLLNNGSDHLLISPVGALDQLVQQFASKSKKIHRILRPGHVWAKHEAEYKMNLAKDLGYRGPIPELEMPVFDYNKKNANSAGRGIKIKRICINASYLHHDQWKMKHWGDDNYTRLINWLSEHYEDYDIVFVGASDDKAHVNKIINNSIREPNYAVHNYCGFSNDIKDTAALIESSALCIGNDGGLQHIASAVGTPTVTVFTFTNPIKNRPLGSQAHLVMVPCDKRLSCQHDSARPCASNGCLDVPFDKVIEKIRNIL